MSNEFVATVLRTSNEIHAGRGRDLNERRRAKIADKIIPLGHFHGEPIRVFESYLLNRISDEVENRKRLVTKSDLNFSFRTLISVRFVEFH